MKDLQASRLVALAHTSFVQYPLLWGSGLMVVTTALWALAFVAPLAVTDASSIEIAMGRFIVYGLISACSFGLSRFNSLSWALKRRAFAYALTGNIVYYILLVAGIQLGDAVMAVLIIGMLPVTVAIAGRSKSNPGSFQNLTLSLLIFVLGIVLFNAAKTDFFRDVRTISPASIVCVATSLAMWTWYAVDNARFLKSMVSISEKDWSSIVGIASLGVAIPVLPFGWLTGFARNPMTLDSTELLQISLWSIVLGAGSTWLGTVLFNIASKRLDISILGQLIVFETIFGIAYVFPFTGAAPSVWGLTGIGIALFGTWLSVRAIYSR